jgi:hypothetical protein
VNRDPQSLPSTSIEIARRLLARDRPSHPELQPEAAGVALQRACTRVTLALGEAMGEAGCTALLARALARTEESHPVLKKMRRLDQDTIHLDGIAESVAAHGVADVTAATEALVAALIDILIRLIGEDMAVRLVDHDGAASRIRGGGRTP